MNKCIIFVSFVLISLLAIGAVSADSNIANESFVQQASLDDEQLNVTCSVQQWIGAFRCL